MLSKMIAQREVYVLFSESQIHLALALMYSEQVIVTDREYPHLVIVVVF
jgi:hypothetical protein